MNGHGKPDGRIVLTNPPSKAASAAAEAGREGAQPRGTRTAQHVPDSGPGKACQTGWDVCVKQHEGTRMRGSLRCCTMSRWNASMRPTGRYALRPLREPAG